MVRVKVRCPACRGARRIDAAGAPSSATCVRCGTAVPLEWTASLRDDREVDACPVCAGRDFYVRKDLNRQAGLAAVVVVGLVSAAFLWAGRDGLAYAVLGAFALVDFLVYPLLKNVTVCYRCQAEFRGAYRRTAPPFDLHAAEELEREYGRRAAAAVRTRPLPH